MRSVAFAGPRRRDGELLQELSMDFCGVWQGLAWISQFSRRDSESSCKFFTVFLREQLAHFSSQLVCATSLASRSSRSSLRSLRAPPPGLSPGVVSAASAELPPGFLPGVVGLCLFLQDFGRCRKDRGEIEEGWAGNLIGLA